ncbi:LacI family DNA-binding transcriptional regulator [Enterococcus sp. AZ072]|uniref:LacI family DNA-binding transcriptional regulator n=1 Tax=unclassified Enterococcus TaxID=2608891 RepID=UPI003D2B15BA
MKLEDVARLANVSKSAASLALNGKPGVSEETREFILKIAQQYNYVPMRKHTKVEEDKLSIRLVACTNKDVITEEYDQLPFFKELLSYIATEASRNHHVLTTNNLPKHHLLEKLTELESHDLSDGIILLGTNLTAAHIAPVNQRFENLVILDTQCNNLNCNTITMNNYQGVYAATRHLVEMGHERIGYIKGLPRINNFYDRRRGFKDALKFYDINPESLPKFYLPAMNLQLIDKNLEKFDAFIADLTAVFCEDDYIAISVLKTLNSLGYSVPEDLSIVGFDDIPECRVTTPELTTIHVPIKEIAMEAITMIENGLTASKVKKQILLNTELIQRNSVKKLSRM